MTGSQDEQIRMNHTGRKTRADCKVPNMLDRSQNTKKNKI